MKLSASKLGLAACCCYSFRDDVEAPATKPGAAAELGTLVHGWACALINGTKLPELSDEATRYRMDSHVHELKQEWPELIAEQAFAYNTETGAVRSLGVDINRAYMLRPGEIPCSIDVLGFDGKGSCLVRDWKSGEQSNTTPASHNLQLAFGALCAQIYYNCTKVVVELAFIDDGGRCYIDRHHHDPISLLDVESIVKDIAKAIPTAQPNPGPHCTTMWCPIKSQCPATVAASAALVAVDKTAKYPLAIMSAKDIQCPEHAAYLLTRLDLVKAAYDTVREAVKDYSNQNGPIPVGEGRVWGKLFTQQEPITASSLESLYDALKDMLSPEEFADIVSVSLPKGKLEKLVRSKYGASGWERAMSNLRERGLTRINKYERHEYYKTGKGR